MAGRSDRTTCVDQPHHCGWSCECGSSAMGCRFSPRRTGKPRSPLRVRVTSTSCLQMGRRRRRPPCLATPLSASSVEMMDFIRIHWMNHTNRVRETYTKHARRCLVPPTLESTSPACRRFSTSGFGGRCPTAAIALSSEKELQRL